MLERESAVQGFTKEESATVSISCSRRLDASAG